MNLSAHRPSAKTFKVNSSTKDVYSLQSHALLYACSDGSCAKYEQILANFAATNIIALPYNAVDLQTAKTAIKTFAHHSCLTALLDLRFCYNFNDRNRRIVLSRVGNVQVSSRTVISFASLMSDNSDQFIANVSPTNSLATYGA